MGQRQSADSYDHDVAVISKIQPEDVLGALRLLDDPVEGPRLLEQLGYKPSKKYRLIWEGRFYDSKPVVGIAVGLQSGEYVNWDGFSGGAIRVASLLTRLGFVVDDGPLYEITQLRVNRVNGRPTPYQYVVLMWAVSRLRTVWDSPVPFSSVRGELAELLAPFAIADTPPDPAMPWLALRGPLWDLDVPDGVTLTSESDIKRFDIAGGLSESFRKSLSEWPSLSRRSAFVDVVDRIIGDHPAFEPTLDKLNLGRVGRTYVVVVDEDWKESWGSRREEDSAPVVPELDDRNDDEDDRAYRRKFGRGLKYAEKRAVEKHAVKMTRDQLEADGYKTKDVGDKYSYDVHATKDGQTIRVEVKGTITSGDKITLTANEVDLHEAEYPNNAFAVVRNIDLDTTVDPPAATGGELILKMSWQIDRSQLEPTQYRYRTGY